MCALDRARRARGKLWSLQHMVKSFAVVGIEMLIAIPFVLSACSRAEPPSPASTSSARSASLTVPATGADPATNAGASAVSRMRVVTKDKLPKGVTVAGKLESAVAWTDKNGENLVTFSRREASGKKGTETFESAYLDIEHVTVADPPRVLRSVKDKVERCDADMLVELRDAALELTDLDGDGIGEITFAYALNCSSDMTPAVLKLLMLEGGEKYILRGTTLIAAAGVDPATGGELQVDPSFKNGPPAFLEHAKRSWLKVRAHSPTDGASAGLGKAKGCAPLSWSKDEHPSADVTALSGKLSRSEGSDLTGRMEPYFTLTLDAPVCTPEGASVPEIQFGPLPHSEAEVAKLSKLVGTRVTVSGHAETPTTVHHRRPVLVFGSARPGS